MFSSKLKNSERRTNTMLVSYIPTLSSISYSVKQKFVYFRFLERITATAFIFTEMDSHMFVYTLSVPWHVCFQLKQQKIFCFTDDIVTEKHHSKLYLLRDFGVLEDECTKDVRKRICKLMLLMIYELHHTVLASYNVFFCFKYYLCMLCMSK